MNGLVNYGDDSENEGNNQILNYTNEYNNNTVY